MLNERRDKILVVDDDKSRRDLIYENLDDEGYWVLEANRLRESDPVSDKEDTRTHAIQWLLKRHFFHAAVIDLSLKPKGEDREGLEVLSAINKQGEGTKSLILTQYGTPALVRDAFKERGAADYLDKTEYNQKFLGMTREIVKNAKLRIVALLNSELNYYELIQQPKLGDIVKYFGSGSEQEIRTVVEGALLPYFPYDKQYIKAEFKSLTIQDKPFPYLTIELWSRYLGNGISLHVGSRQVCEYLEIVIRDGKKKTEGSDFVRYQESPRDRIVAVVEYSPMEYPGDQPADEPEWTDDGTV